MKAPKYKVYDDLKYIGTFRTLKEVYDTGLIKQRLTYFYRAFSVDGYYIRENISVIPVKDQFARCVYLAHMLQRRVKMQTNTFDMDIILTRALKDLSGIMI